MISRMTDEVTVDVVELRCELSEWASRMAGTEREKLLRYHRGYRLAAARPDPRRTRPARLQDHRGRIPEAGGRAGRAELRRTD